MSAPLGKSVLQVNNLCLAREDQFGVDAWWMCPCKCVRVKWWASPVCRATAKKSCCTRLSGEDCARRRSMAWCLGNDAARMGQGRSRKLGVHFVPEERLGRGAVPTLGLAHNLLLTRTGAIGKARAGSIRQGPGGAGQAIIARFHVKAGGPNAAAKSLSGGNLQKFIVGREIDANPKLLIVSQPTWGVDVGAAAQIRGEILKLRDEGCAVLVVSEELDELFESVTACM
jgi:ABC-type uncharacterized transport system ATPase subunit